MFEKLSEKASDEEGKSQEPSPTHEPILPGYTPSTSAPSASTFSTRFASLSMHMQDLLRFLSFPPSVIDSCRTAIRTSWKRGIQAERDYAGSTEIKLRGYPWQGAGEQAIQARRLVSALLATLHSEGWVLTLNTDISKRTSDKDTLLFRYQSPPPAECEWCSIAFSRMDRLRFIDAPPDVYTSLPIRLRPSWLKTHKLHSEGIYDFMFHGTPWNTMGTNAMKVRELLLILLATLEEEGWTVYASINQKSGRDDQSETDTWHCCRPKGWVKGAPVYHS